MGPFFCSRYLYNEVNSRFPSLPFSLRALEDEKQVKRFAARCCCRFDASGSRWMCVIVALCAQIVDPILQVPGMAGTHPKLFSTLVALITMPLFFYLHN